MRKIIATESISLDGVMETPGEWVPAYSDEEMEEANASGIAGSDALLLGRVTYEELSAFWPTQSNDDPMAEYINNVPKYVVSTTPKEVDWYNLTLIDGNVSDEIANLKEQSGDDIAIIGSGTLVRSLLSNGLLDELVLMVHPLVLGEGKRLFESASEQKGLELLESTTSDTGVVKIAYRPKSEEQTK